MLEAIIHSCKKAALAVGLSLGLYGCGDTNITINNYVNLNDGGQVDSDDGQVDSNSSQLNVIEIYSTGFVPPMLPIDLGETVTFINRDINQHWPASSFHPTHNVYPGSGIQKCGTAEESTIFDSCSGLSEGESYSFMFEYEGTHPYQDHLNPSLHGTIIVGSGQLDYSGVDLSLNNVGIDWKGTWGKIVNLNYTINNGKNWEIHPKYLIMLVEGYDTPENLIEKKIDLPQSSKTITSGASSSAIVIVPQGFAYNQLTAGDLRDVQITLRLHDLVDRLMGSFVGNFDLEE